jgi:signal transduction histidine kinase
MMAMLAEIRLLKRLAVADPGALTEELARAEKAAHQGLKEARDAIAQMRFNPVRDEGLAAALGDFVTSFIANSWRVLPSSARWR